jgi:hypothetical protein
MKSNKFLENLSLKDNCIMLESLAPFFEACISN